MELTSPKDLAAFAAAYTLTPEKEPIVSTSAPVPVVRSASVIKDAAVNAAVPVLRVSSSDAHSFLLNLSLTALIQAADTAPVFVSLKRLTSNGSIIGNPQDYQSDFYAVTEATELGNLDFSITLKGKKHNQTGVDMTPVQPEMFRMWAIIPSLTDGILQYRVIQFADFTVSV